jgi:osmotically-inducible protein OsmY
MREKISTLTLTRGNTMRKVSFLIIFGLLLIQPVSVFAAHGDHSANAVIQKRIAHTQKEISDAAITTKVKAKLLADPEINGMNITVSTVSHVVTLTGRVKSDAEKKLAEEIAADTHGVKDVHNQLDIE